MWIFSLPPSRQSRAGESRGEGMTRAWVGEKKGNVTSWECPRETKKGTKAVVKNTWIYCGFSRLCDSIVVNSVQHFLKSWLDVEGLRLINFNRRSEKFVALNSKVFNRRTSIVDSAIALSKLRIYSGIDKVLTEFKSPSSACPCAGCRLLDGAWSEMTQPENSENLVTCTSMCTLVK